LQVRFFPIAPGTSRYDENPRRQTMGTMDKMKDKAQAAKGES